MSGMNESCHVWMSYATYEWVMSHEWVMSRMNESHDIWMSHAHMHAQALWSHVCRIKIMFTLLPTNCFISTKTNSIKCFVNWKVLRIRVWFWCVFLKSTKVQSDNVIFWKVFRFKYVNSGPKSDLEPPTCDKLNYAKHAVQCEIGVLVIVLTLQCKTIQFWFVKRSQMISGT